MRVLLKFDKGLASKIYAASDLYLMPSKSEPCGLSQLIAMRYGALPLVHKTGGLCDTVLAFDEYGERATGFGFSAFCKEALTDTLDGAIGVYSKKNKKLWSRLVLNALRSEVSWNVPAGEYMSLYKDITGTV